MDNEPKADLELMTAEQATLHHLIDGSDEPQALIPANIGTDQFWEYLTVISKAEKRIQIIDLRLRPIIGRMLLIASNNPNLYLSRGYANFEDFLTGLDAMGLKRTTSYNAKQLAKNFPTLSPERFQRIGVEKIRTLSRFTNETMPDCQRHLAIAEQLSGKDFTKYAEDGGYINKGEADKYVIEIITTREIGEAWEEYRKDGRVTSNCGTTDPGVILMHTMAEASSELLTARPVMENQSQKVTEAIESFLNDSRVHSKTGTTDRSWNLLWALAKALDSVAERNVEDDA